MVNIIFLLSTYFISYQNFGKIRDFQLKLENGSKMPYSIYIPNTIKKNEDLPLIICLHWGWDRSKPLPSRFGKEFFKELVEPALSKNKAIVVIPDCPSEKWNDTISEKAIQQLFAKIKSDYKIDEARVIIAGFSAGGIGTWYIASQIKETFRYIIPIACSPDPEWISGLSNLDVLIIHGQNDELFPVNHIIEYNKLLNDQGVNSQIVVIPSATHYEIEKYIVPLYNVFKQILDK